MLTPSSLATPTPQSFPTIQIRTEAPPVSRLRSIWRNYLHINRLWILSEGRTDLVGLLRGTSAEERLARLPDQTYHGRITLHLGGKEIRILHLGRAHTRGDSIVFVPEDRIAYLSEVFDFEEFPYTRDSYPGEWLRILEAAEALDADIFVPGHGFLPDDRRETRDGLRRHRQLLLDVRDAVQRQIEEGATEEQAVAAVALPRYRRFRGYSRAMEMAVRRWYRELTVGLD